MREPDPMGLRLGSRDLPTWWRETVNQDIERTLPKIEQYGTRDLVAMGRFMADHRDIELTGANAAIYGCLIYALGKISRAVAAVERGDDPTEDTLFDLSIYAMMARSYQNRGEL